MNLTRVLNNALPDLPARTLVERPPRLDPGVTFREHMEEGKPKVRVYVPSAKGMYKFSPSDWKLVQFFDGVRSFEEIAEIYSQETGAQYSAESVREFSAMLEENDFWYKTAQEKNILLLQQSAEERRKKLKQHDRWADLGEVTFPAFNPDPFLTTLYHYTRFVYSAWFTTLTLVIFIFTAWLTVTHWSEIGRDTNAFYTFSNKSWVDILVLYLILFAIVVVHEFAHAYASKHFGGRVTAMGFCLIYLAPAFYTDTTESEVTATTYQRLIVTIAGVWSELIICSIATLIWWGSAPDTPVHNGAYFMMMCTGILSIVLNWNPLMKLDGYYILSDLSGIQDIKENSTAFVSAWVKKQIWRLPVEIPYVPPKRRFWFATYALLSGVYSYTVLYWVARFTGNIVRNFSPEWGFVPEIAVALMIFRSRIQLLVNFMKFLYLDKKDRVVAWFTPWKLVAAAAILGLLLGLPLWRESVPGRFLLEPSDTAVIRARVSGTVTQLDAKEGQQVMAGTIVASLRNVPMQSDLEYAKTRLSVASERVKAASREYADYGLALKEKEGLAGEVEQLSDMESELQITSPIAGTVITPRLHDLVGNTVKAGQELLQVADLSSMRARIYISEYDLYKIRAEARARLQVNGLFQTWAAQIVSVASTPAEMDSRLAQKVELKGMNPPHFYVVDMLVQNPEGVLKPGMTGVARVYGRRRSLLGLGWEIAHNFLGRKAW